MSFGEKIKASDKTISSTSLGDRSVKIMAVVPSRDGRLKNFRPQSRAEVPLHFEVPFLS